MNWRWLFKDLDTNEEYRFRRNPMTMTTPTLGHRTQAFVGHRPTAFRQGIIPVQFSFRGTLYTKTEYDTLLDWSTRRLVRLTDHRGRVMDIIPQGFDPTPRRSGLHELAWRFDYTFKALLVRRVS